MAGRNGFMQTTSAAQLRKIIAQSSDLTEFDRDAVTAFLSGTGAGEEGYVPKSGQITGILKQMLEDFEKDLDEVVKQENGKKETYDELMKAKTKEVQTHTEQIERKTALVGELSVEIVHMKNSLTDAEAALIEDQAFLKDLEANCGTKNQEWDERVKTRSQELVAIADTIKILNDDDALELFKKTLPGSAASFFVQVDDARVRAREILRKLARGRNNRPDIDFLALALDGKKVDFSKVIKMIDDMVALLKEEQSDDNHKKEYCTGQIDFSEDKSKELKHKIADLDTIIADSTETIKATTEDIAALAAGIQALDASVLESAIQRKKEHEEYIELISSDTAAKELLEFAKNRLNKFYNPKLYKSPPKRELTEEERIYTNMGGQVAAASFVQESSSVQVVAVRHKDDPGPPPETFGEYKKSESSSGAVAMIDLLIRDLDKEMTEAKQEEKDSQKDYEEMMDDAAKKRAEDTKSIAEKESAKADAEKEKSTAENAKNIESEELSATQEYMVDLHNECDWLLQNFDIRVEARAQEVDQLNKAKAILSGADFSLIQKHGS